MPSQRKKPAQRHLMCDNNMRIEKEGEQTMSGLEVVLAIIGVLIATLVVISVPDIKRYIKISRM
jgi:uncharacterized membrane protein YgaE (UPF0421/DUF939 family)